MLPLSKVRSRPSCIASTFCGTACPCPSPFLDVSTITTNKTSKIISDRFDSSKGSELYLATRQAKRDVESVQTACQGCVTCHVFSAVPCLGGVMLNFTLMDVLLPFFD